MTGGRRFDKSKYKDLRDFKQKEIQKSLTHRARLRKNYFKLLQKEDPERYEAEIAKEREEKEGHDHKKRSSTEEKEKDTSETKDVPERAKRLTFAEKAQLVKQRKEEKRKQALEQVAERKNRIEKANRDREKQKERISKRTRHGQPLMGPRINNLLDKIKKDME